jgi:NMD protein affecting ribosome stability and mRNA decay
MERDGFKCHSCGKGEDDAITLNVHHSYYEKGKKPWEYDDETLVTMCDTCHVIRHRRDKFVRTQMAMLTNKQYNGLLNIMTPYGGVDFFESMSNCQIANVNILSEIAKSLSKMWKSGYFCGTEEAE